MDGTLRRLRARRNLTSIKKRPARLAMPRPPATRARSALATERDAERRGGLSMTDIRDLGRAALAAAGLLLAAAAPAWAGNTERVSVSSSGEQGNADSFGS